MTQTEMEFKTKTAAVLLIERLNEASGPLAVHELNIIGHSQNALATDLSILSREGKVVGRYRVGFRYKEWTTLERANAMRYPGASGFSLHPKAAF